MSGKVALSLGEAMRQNRKSYSNPTEQVKIEDLSLRNITKNCLHKQLIESTMKHKAGMRPILIVDDDTLKIINSVFRNSDLLTSGIVCVEHIDRIRKRRPHIDAIYYIQVSEYGTHSFEKTVADLQDFDEKRIKTDMLSKIMPCVFRPLQIPRMFRRVFFFGNGILRESEHKDFVADFLGAKPDGTNKPLRKVKYTRVNYELIADNAFVFGMNDAVTDLYHSQEYKRNIDLDAQLAQKLVDLFTLIGDFPKVRYQKGSEVAHDIAKLLENTAATASMKRNDTIIIVERSYDLALPFLHELYYESMVYDQLEVDPIPVIDVEIPNSMDRFRAGHSDEIWRNQRHRFLNFALEHIQNQIQTLRGSAMAKLQNGTKQSELSNSEMMDAIDGMLHGGRENIADTKKHLQMVTALMDKFEHSRLRDIVSFEQLLATSYDEEGKTASSSRLLSRMMSFMRASDIGVKDKARLLVLYILNRGGIKQKERVELTAAAGLGDLEQAVLNLNQLGANMQVAPSKKVPSKRRNGGELYDDWRWLSRYTPKVKTILEDFRSKRLSHDQFPMIKGSDSSAPAARSVRQSGGEQRTIVFVVGGMTHSEIRACWEVQEEAERMRQGSGKKHVFMIGSTHMITPQSFLEQLQALS